MLRYLCVWETQALYQVDPLSLKRL